MKILGIDLGGCFSSNSAFVYCEIDKKIKFLKEPFLEPKHKSYIECNDYLLKIIKSLSFDILTIDSPFSIPAVLCDKDFKTLKREEEKEISNPYLYRYTDYFIFKKFGIKPMPPAGDRIGRVTARTIRLLRDLNYDGDFVYVNDKKIAVFEVFPRQIGEFLCKKDYKNSKNNILKKLKITSFKDIFFKNDHFFDALLAAYGGYEIIKSNTIYPINDKIKKEGWIYPVIKFSLGE